MNAGGCKSLESPADFSRKTKVQLFECDPAQMNLLLSTGFLCCVFCFFFSLLRTAELGERVN